MKYSKLNEGVRVSQLCFGCEPLGGTDWGEVNITDIEYAIKRAIDLGVNFFDTADVYGLGLSEERLSAILGEHRHDMVIATKGGVAWTKDSQGRAKTRMDSSPEYLRSAVEASLRRLRLDRLPVYYIHWPDPNTSIQASFECLAQLQEEGKIGLLGCSNYNEQQLTEATKVANISLVQLPLNLIEAPLAPSLIKFCRKKDIKIVAYNVLASGLLTGKYNQGTCFPSDDRRSRLPLFQGQRFRDALDSVAQAEQKAQHLNLSVGEYAVRWVVSQSCVASAITGIKNKAQIEQNVGGII